MLFVEIATLVVAVFCYVKVLRDSREWNRMWREYLDQEDKK